MGNCEGIPKTPVNQGQLLSMIVTMGSVWRGNRRFTVSVTARGQQWLPDAPASPIPLYRFKLGWLMHFSSDNLSPPATQNPESVTLTPCGNPKNFANGTFKLYGKTIHFKCNVGFWLDGDQDIKCQNDGAWSARTPRCIRTPLRFILNINPFDFYFRLLRKWPDLMEKSIRHS